MFIFTTLPGSVLESLQNLRYPNDKRQSVTHRCLHHKQWYEEGHRFGLWRNACIADVITLHIRECSNEKSKNNTLYRYVQPGWIHCSFFNLKRLGGGRSVLGATQGGQEVNPVSTTSPSECFMSHWRNKHHTSRNCDPSLRPI